MIKAMQEVDELFRRITRVDIWKMKSQRSNNRKLKTITENRLSILKRVIEVAKEVTKSSRCALLMPTENDPSLWSYFATTGFEGNIDRGLVARGVGLTGMTLDMPTEGHIVSTDVENDNRWSRQYGDSFVRNQHEQGSLAFLGLPLSPRLVFTGKRPAATAAIVFLRSVDRVGPYSDFEILLAKHIANHIAYALDTFEWREKESKVFHQFEEVSRLDLECPNKNSLGAKVLEVLASHVRGADMLISVVDCNRTEVRGIAVNGRFSSSIVDETVRPLHTASDYAVDISFDNKMISKEVRRASNSERNSVTHNKEDSLSLFIRNNYRYPAIVDPCNANDPLANSLQHKTEAKHRIRSKHLFIPLLDEFNNTIGVVIAVSGKDQGQLIRRCQDWTLELDIPTIKFWADQLGVGIARYQRKEEEMRRSSIRAVLHEMIQQDFLDEQSIERFSGRLIQTICENYNFECAIVYRFDARNGVLRGVCGYNVNQPAVKRTLYRTTLDQSNSSSQDDSMAVEVFRTRRSLHVASMKSDVVDQVDRIRVEIPSELAGFATPLLQGNTAKGVLVLCYRNDCVPHYPIPVVTSLFRDWIAQVGGVLAAMFTCSETLDQKNQDSRVRIAQSTIMQQIEDLIQGDQKQPREVSMLSFAKLVANQLNGIVEDAGKIFGAQVTGVFLAEDPVVIRLEDSTDSSSTHRHLANRKFYLVTGTGYKQESMLGTCSNTDTVLSYTASARSLTSHVLWSQAPQRTEDVENDIRWSKKGETHIEFDTFLDEFDQSGTDDLQLRKQSGPLRAWMGVPIAFNDTQNRHVYGVLAFTKIRKFERDRLSFSEYDVATAKSIATMLSVVLHQREEVGRLARLIDSLLQTFRHEDTGDFIGWTRESLERIGDSNNLLDGSCNDIKKNISNSCHDGLASLDLIQSVFDAYSSFVGKSSTWDTKRKYSLQEIFGVVFESLVIYANNSVAIEHSSLSDLPMVNIDRSKSRYILLAIVRNAIKSCNLSNLPDRKIMIDIKIDRNSSDAVSLCVSVADNGVGIRRNDLSSVFKEGFSGFGGSGIGLSIVKRLLGLVSVNGLVGTCEFQPLGIGGEGTTCLVRIPISEC